MREILIYLFSMEDDPQFELTQDELHIFAEKLMNDEEKILPQIYSIACTNSFIRDTQAMLSGINLSSSTKERINVFFGNTRKKKCIYNSL